MLSARFMTRGVSIIATAILASILSPTEFGLITIGLLVVSFLRVFTEIGVKQALIRESEQNAEEFLNTAWTVEVLRGFCIFLSVFFLAPWIAGFFKASGAEDVIRALALIPFLNGLTSIRIIYLQKQLIFRKQFLYEISGALAPIAVSIPLAIVLKNVWAIVIGSLAAELIRLVMSYYLMPYRPKIRFDISHFLRIFDFGKWIVLGSIVSFFAMQLDTVYAAKILSTSGLGIYVMAFSLTNKPITELAKSLNKVFFPAFAQIGNDPLRVKKAFSKSTGVLYSIIIPVAMGIFIIAEDFVVVFLGDTWLEMIPLMSVLAFSAMFRGFTIPSVGLFCGIGKPNLNVNMNTVRLIILFALLNLLVLVGATPLGITLAVLFANGSIFLQFVFQTFKHTRVTLKDWGVMIFPLFVAVSVMIVPIMVMKGYVNPGPTRFVFILIFGGFSYVAILALFWSLFKLGPYDHYSSLLLRCFHKIRSNPNDNVA